MPLKIISKPHPFDVAIWGLLLTAAIAAIYYLQLASMRDSVDLSRTNMQIDQRPWIYVDVPTFFPLNGPNIPANIHVSNIGKTPATHIIGHVIGTVLNKGERPNLDEYSRGHAYTNIYFSALYQGQKPQDVNLLLVQYTNEAGAKSQKAIVPDDDLRRQIQQQEKFVVLFGEIRYCDIFGIPHWTKFCDGGSDALGLNGIKECIYYNRTDNEQTPSHNCTTTIPSAN